MKHYGRLVALVVVLAGLALGLGVTASPVEAKKNPCSLKRCKPAIKARCAGFKKKAKRDCRRGIISMCKSGICSCTVGTPLCADPPTTTVPTTTVETTSSTTSSSTTTTTLMSGACLRDIGDGTIHDVCAGLQWEKKVATPGLQNVDTLYGWAGCCNGDCSNVANLCQPNAEAAATCAAHAEDGAQGCATCASGTCNVDVDQVGVPTTVWDWINQLNAASFAGHNDWRVPSQAGSNTVSAAKELESILDLTAPNCGIDMPCIDPIFGPTSADAYTSATTVNGFPDMMWVGNFGAGNVGSGSKQFGYYARAVRNDD
jgi:uncharacterized protein DUF1566